MSQVIQGNSMLIKRRPSCDSIESSARLSTKQLAGKPPPDSLHQDLAHTPRSNWDGNGA